jgi:DNA-directed RNA polymerase subunit RPC12/RpoP
MTECARCGKEMEPMTPEEEEEALAEMVKLFGPGAIDQEMAVVCDDCFQIVRPDSPENRHIFDAWQKTKKP